MNRTEARVELKTASQLFFDYCRALFAIVELRNKCEELSKEIRPLQGDVADLQELNSSLNAKLLAERQKHEAEVKSLMGQIGELKRKAVRKKTAPQKKEVNSRMEQFSLLEEQLEQLLYSAGVDIDLPPLTVCSEVHRAVYQKCKDVSNGEDMFPNNDLTPNKVLHEVKTILSLMGNIYPHCRK